MHSKEEKQAMLVKLKPFLQRGVPLYRACEYCKMSEATVRYFCEKDPVYKAEIDTAKNHLLVIAESVMSDSISVDKNIETTKWYLERRAKTDYSKLDNLALSGEVTSNINLSETIQNELNKANLAGKGKPAKPKSRKD